MDDILKKWEIENPLQVIDILGLMGDSVDNIPGVPGVGRRLQKINSAIWKCGRCAGKY